MTDRFGRLLNVDLDAGKIWQQQLAPGLIEPFIGGSGLAARLLWDRLTKELDPLGPSNPLLFITGPLTGTAGPANGRFSVCAKSPATGIWGESNCGGFWGSELRFAGYDAILITGRASIPVYLWVHSGAAELRDASRLWGTSDTYQTQDLIKQETSESLARVACIGKAGESQIPFASILCDHGRVAGRTGMGAVMGSKNLKAIAVRGKQPLPIEHPEVFRPLRAAATRALLDENETRALRAAGSGAAAEIFQFYGEMPIHYFTSGQFEGQELVSGNAVADTILTGVSTCHACVIACGRRVIIPEGPYTRPESKGPEWETMMGFGSVIGSSDMSAATHIGQLCDAYGLDTISASNTIGLAYLLYQRGFLPEADLDGLRLAWGDPRPAEALVHKIISGEGTGALLRHGARALARHYGAEALAAQVNNLEAPYHDPRAMTGMSIVYATSPRGACHMQSDFFLAEMGSNKPEIGIPILTPPVPDEGKAKLVAIHQDYRAISNSLTICMFARVPIPVQLALFNAVAGMDWSLEEFMLAGGRIWNLKRAINHRLGLTRANDSLPKILLAPVPDGPNAGHVPDFDLLMQEYYAARGWGEEDGRPTRATLEKYGLEFAAEALVCKSM
jgi:aldehyde:ferredoxin oxidoreductase